MSKVKRLVYLLMGLNIVLVLVLLLYKPPQKAEAQPVCIPIPTVTTLNWSAMYKVRGPGGTGGHAFRNVSCTGTDVRVACFAIGFDNLELENVTPFAPNGCTIEGDDDARWWPIALCVPQT